LLKYIYLNLKSPHANMKLLKFLPLALLLTSCSLFSGLSEVEYNNRVVELTNLASTAIEQTATLYNETIPNKVTEQDEIDISQMETAYEEATKALEGTNDALNMESRNLEQQNAVQTALQTYLSAGELYLENYNTVIVYYSNSTYKDDVTKVEVYDESLHTSYTTFIEANNDLVEALDSFVIEEE